jgi:plastocyanin
MLAICLCGSLSASAGAAKTWQVSIFAGFIPQSVTISSCDSVTWRNTDTSDHNVTAIDGTFKSGNLKPGQTFTWTFRNSGVEKYECTIHPRETGTVIVQ